MSSKYRESLNESAKESQDLFDKYILLLSTGALGASFSFLRDIAGPGPYLCLGALILSWYFWTVSIISTLISFPTSRRAHEVKFDQPEDDRSRSGYETTTEVLNLLSGTAFIAGIVSIAIFVFNNLNLI